MLFGLLCNPTTANTMWFSIFSCAFSGQMKYLFFVCVRVYWIQMNLWLKLFWTLICNYNSRLNPTWHNSQTDHDNLLIFIPLAIENTFQTCPCKASPKRIPNNRQSWASWMALAQKIQLNLWNWLYKSTDTTNDLILNLNFISNGNFHFHMYRNQRLLKHQILSGHNVAFIIIAIALVSRFQLIISLISISAQ